MITISNIHDLEKPAHLISTPMQSAIFMTGIIWARYSTQVTPVNYNLMIVNVFMAMSAGYQLYRKYKLQGQPVPAGLPASAQSSSGH